MGTFLRSRDANAEPQTEKIIFRRKYAFLMRYVGFDPCQNVSSSNVYSSTITVTEASFGFKEGRQGKDRSIDSMT